MDNHIYLSDKEWLALKMLSEEKCTAAIRRECGMGTLEFTPFMVGLRRRTGIKETRNLKAVRDYIQRYTEAINGPGPSKQQLELIKRVLGVEHAAIPIEGSAFQMSISQSEATQMYQEGLRAMGIFTNDEREQRVQARYYLATFHPMPICRHLSNEHEQVLAMLMVGTDKRDIADAMDRRLSYVNELISDMAIRCGVSTRGRGLQEKLICATMRARKAAEITMDDPAF